MMDFNVHGWSRTLATLTWLAPGDLAIKSAIILVAAWAAVLVLRRASAATRHLVWALAVGAVLTMPVLSGVLPKWRVLPAWIGQAASLSVSATAAETMPGAAGADAVSRATIMRLPHDSTAPPIVSGVPRNDGADGIPPRSFVPLMHTDSPIVAAGIAAAQTLKPVLAHWQSWMAIAWALGTAVLVVPILVSLIGLWRMGRSLPRIESGPWALLNHDLAVALKLHRPVVLLRGRPKAMPMTWGVLRPKLVLPPEADDWSPQRRHVVLIHELAHVKRADFVVQFLVQLARAIYWFNPLMWVASKQIALESEGACDDLVLARQTRASDYAEHLLAIAAGLQEAFFLNTAAVAMARPSRLEARLVGILDGRRDRTMPTRARAAVLGILLAAMIIPVAALRAGNGPGEQAPADRSKPGKVGDVAAVSFGPVITIKAEDGKVVMEQGGTKVVADRIEFAGDRLKLTGSGSLHRDGVNAQGAVVVVEGQSREPDGPAAAPATQPALVYGPVVDGLQLALEIEATNGLLPMGKPIRARLHFRNAGQVTIKLKNPTLWQPSSDEVVITDQSGKRVQGWSAWFSFWDVGRVDELRPGQSVAVDTNSLGFFPEGSDPAKVPHPIGNYAFVKPGKFTVQYRLRSPTNDADDVVSWRDQLAAAPVQVEIVPNEDARLSR